MYLGHTFKATVAERCDLLSNHRQDLNIDAVELIETGPATTLRQPTKDSSDEAIVHVLAAVEYDAEYRQGLCEVLG